MLSERRRRRAFAQVLPGFLSRGVSKRKLRRLIGKAKAAGYPTEIAPAPNAVDRDFVPYTADQIVIRGPADAERKSRLSELAERIAALTRGMEVDLDAPIEGDVDL